VSFTPSLKGFQPGAHAFHVHERPDCGPGMSSGKPVAGLAAGAHYAGRHTAMGGMQMGNAHTHMTMAGDLPELVAMADGSVTLPVTKSGLTLAELRGKSVMIHSYGEQPSDPNKPKGGGARIACAVIP
jgi:Cu-Zn family superoxide dismutase